MQTLDNILVPAIRAAGLESPREIMRVVRHVRHGRTLEYAIWAEITQGGTIDTHLYPAPKGA